MTGARNRSGRRFAARPEDTARWSAGAFTRFSSADRTPRVFSRFTPLSGRYDRFTVLFGDFYKVLVAKTQARFFAVPSRSRATTCVQHPEHGKLKPRGGVTVTHRAHNPEDASSNLVCARPLKHCGDVSDFQSDERSSILRGGSESPRLVPSDSRAVTARSEQPEG